MTRRTKLLADLHLAQVRIVHGAGGDRVRTTAHAHDLSVNVCAERLFDAPARPLSEVALARRHPQRIRAEAPGPRAAIEAGGRWPSRSPPARCPSHVHYGPPYRRMAASPLARCIASRKTTPKHRCPPTVPVEQGMQKHSAAALPVKSPSALARDTTRSMPHCGPIVRASHGLIRFDYESIELGSSPTADQGVGALALH